MTDDLTDEAEDYAIQRLRDALAADDRVGELGVQVRTVAGKVLLTGQVSTPERRKAVGTVAAEILPDHEVHNETLVTPVMEGPKVERIR